MKRRCCWLSLLTAIVACNDAPAGPAPSVPPNGIAPPTVRIVTVQPNATNVLAASVIVETRGADSVHLRFHALPEAPDSVTPMVVVTDSTQRLPVYGLLPEQPYVIRAVAFGAGGATVSDSVTLTTAALPADLPTYTTRGTGAPGFVVFAHRMYGLVIDNTGRVVWYHRVAPAGPGLSFVAQSNGRYATLPPPFGGATAGWQEVNPDGEITRSFGCSGGLAPRFHDLIREADDSYWVICDAVRTMDLSAIGGRSDARVTAAEIQHLNAEGTQRFVWNAFDHLDISDLDSASRGGPVVNWTHANAIALHSDSILLASFRNLHEIIAIDRRSGEVAWHLGGRKDSFGLTACCAPLFARQHGLRVTESGSLIFLDNSGTPGNSRVQRYSLDLSTRRARMDAALSGSPPAFAMQGGSVQELSNGNLLVSFGDGHRVQELDATGRTVWSIEGDPGYVFRAQRISSLYTPGMGGPR